MLDAEVLKHPVIQTCVDALADGRGGLVVYEQGLGGRETLVAAAVRIAHATGKKLTIVDAEVLREATADLAGQLGLAEHTFLSPAQAARWPTGFDPDAVLSVHGDVLRNRDLVEPLRAAARDASVHGHLVVARHSYGSAALDTYPPSSARSPQRPPHRHPQQGRAPPGTRQSLSPDGKRTAGRSRTRRSPAPSGRTPGESSG